MSVEVAGSPCVVGNNGQCTLYGHWKLKGQNSTINASKPLILRVHTHTHTNWATFYTPLILLFSPQSQGSVLAFNLPLLGSIP